MVDFLSYHVNAKPKASSTKRPAKVQNDPAIGIYAAISPSESIVRMTIQPTMRYAINIEAGPPVARDFPVPRKRPVPIVLTSVKTWLRVITSGNLTRRLLSSVLDERIVFVPIYPHFWDDWAQKLLPRRLSWHPSHPARSQVPRRSLIPASMRISCKAV